MKTMAQRESAREREREQAREHALEQARERIRTRRLEHWQKGPYYALIAISGVLATAAERLAHWPPGIGRGPWAWDDALLGLLFVLLNMFALLVVSLPLGVLAAQVVIWFDRKSRAG